MTRPRYMTTPCGDCGEPLVHVGAEGKIVPLDPTVPVYVCERDGDGAAVWARDDSGLVMAPHRPYCKGARR